jgi:hypothetical protein
VAAPLAVAAGVGVELAVLHRQDTMAWVAPLLGAGGVAAALALAAPVAGSWRAWIVGGALGLLAIAPATWAVQTLGHATSGTFPMGGPATAGLGGFGGPGGGGPGGAPPGGGPGGGPMGAGPGGARGGGFGGVNASLTEAIAYVQAHGGGTLGVSSQSSAAAAVLNGGAGVSVAGLGGFSGNESEVSVAWLAQAVADGRIRYVLADSAGGGGFRDGRAGASMLMSAVQEVGRETSVSGLYDLQGLGGALAALAG